MRTRASTADIEVARASSYRCQQAPDFFRRFYNHLLASSPEIPPHFATTRFDLQEKLLQHGILLLLIYAKRANPALLARIAGRHGSGDLNIPSRFYPLFVDSFLATAQECDAEFAPPIAQAWRAALAPGIEFIAGTST
jgi:hemoglobin-like flavoprotein